MKLYGLSGYGFSWLYEVWWQVPSKRLYTTREGAESDRESFLERLCNPTDDDCDCLKRETITIDVQEFELVGEAKATGRSK
jgi:hypothetical protein